MKKDHCEVCESDWCLSKASLTERSTPQGKEVFKVINRFFCFKCNSVWEDYYIFEKTVVLKELAEKDRIDYDVLSARLGYEAETKKQNK